PNELVRLHQARALVEFHALDLNNEMRTFGPVRDLAFYSGKFYSSKAPLLAFAAVPIYAALRLFGPVHEIPLVYFARLLLTVLPTLLMLLLLARFLAAYVSRPVVEAMVVTYALGTLAFSYSLLFMSHQTTAVLLYASFYVLWRLTRGEWKERGYLLA